MTECIEDIYNCKCQVCTGMRERFPEKYRKPIFPVRLRTKIEDPDGLTTTAIRHIEIDITEDEKLPNCFNSWVVHSIARTIVDQLKGHTATGLMSIELEWLK